MKDIPILIDGPNYINRIIELKIGPVHIARQLSLDALRDALNEKLREFTSLISSSESIEFICSKKRFGPNSKKFSENQQSTLLNRFRAETGVHVDIVDIPGSSEKGVDTTISGKIEEYANDVEAIVLVSADRDFIPTIKKMRHKIKIFLVALHKNYPIELQNEAYATLFLYENYRGLFKYHYPRFHIDNLNEENCAELFSEADDRIFNQLRVSYDGYVYISKTVGAENLIDVKFRWETFVAYNGYVGPKIASNAEYIKNQLKEIKLAWKVGAKDYIDYPILTMYPDAK